MGTAKFINVKWDVHIDSFIGNIKFFDKDNNYNISYTKKILSVSSAGKSSLIN